MDASEQSNRGSLDDRLAPLAALAEPARRRLYDFVVRQAEPVNRDQAAAGVGVPRHVAKFHLDRLVDGGLLDVEYRRPPGRGGPGAGRPAKLYRRSDKTLEVSVPPRRYEVVGRVLAQAVTETERTGAPLAESVADAAAAAGLAAGREARHRAGPRASRADVLAAGLESLAAQGFEPAADASGVALRNCPFEVLSRDYTELVCGLNLRFMEGWIAGLDRPDLTARLEPRPGACCVRLVAR
jgi:predicted ArsR family transcriptional regulator